MTKYNPVGVISLRFHEGKDHKSINLEQALAACTWIGWRPPHLKAIIQQITDNGSTGGSFTGSLENANEAVSGLNKAGFIAELIKNPPSQSTIDAIRNSIGKDNVVEGV